jgi:DNA repair exonuclease SbcCD ATPase subunit
MATDNMAGLFSTPEQYQQARIDQQRAQAIQMAQLDPFQQGQANVQMGMNRLADVGAGALGIQDPMLKLQSMRQQVLQGLDPNDSASITKAAQALAQAGDQQGAMQLAQRALEIRNVESQISGRTEEKQAQRALQLQMAQEKNQTAKEIAADRNALMAQIAQMNSALRGANSDVQRQLIEQRIQDLQSKADEKQATLQSQAQGRVAAFDSALDTLNTVANHPGKKDVVGAVTGGVRSMIPGTDAAGFKAQLETFKAQTFIPMVATLKGMGALSDAEGKKLTAAVGALDTSMKQSEFDRQVTKIKGDLEAARQRAMQMPGMGKQAPATLAAPAKVVKFSDLP